MGKVFCIMGKSAAGKDAVYRQILRSKPFKLYQVLLHTTRPRRGNEEDGVDYFFSSEEELAALEQSGQVVECRAYHTTQGIWKYFTVDNGQFDLEAHHYLLVGTLECYEKYREYFGKDKIVPIYVEIEDGIRLQRALDRESIQVTPQYAEMCRRFLADAVDFSEENIEQAGIEHRFYNWDLKDCVQEILAYMKAVIGEDDKRD